MRPRCRRSPGGRALRRTADPRSWCRCPCRPWSANWRCCPRCSAARRIAPAGPVTAVLRASKIPIRVLPSVRTPGAPAAGEAATARKRTCQAEILNRVNSRGLSCGGRCRRQGAIRQKRPGRAAESAGPRSSWQDRPAAGAAGGIAELVAQSWPARRPGIDLRRPAPAPLRPRVRFRLPRPAELGSVSAGDSHRSKRPVGRFACSLRRPFAAMAIGAGLAIEGGFALWRLGHGRASTT